MNIEKELLVHQDLIKQIPVESAVLLLLEESHYNIHRSAFGKLFSTIVEASSFERFFEDKDAVEVNFHLKSQKGSDIIMLSFESIARELEKARKISAEVKEKTEDVAQSLQKIIAEGGSITKTEFNAFKEVVKEAFLEESKDANFYSDNVYFSDFAGMDRSSAKHLSERFIQLIQDCNYEKIINPDVETFKNFNEIADDFIRREAFVLISEFFEQEAEEVANEFRETAYDALMEGGVLHNIYGKTIIEELNVKEDYNEFIYEWTQELGIYPDFDEPVQCLLEGETEVSISDIPYPEMNRDQSVIANIGEDLLSCLEEKSLYDNSDCKDKEAKAKLTDKVEALADFIKNEGYESGVLGYLNQHGITFEKLMSDDKMSEQQQRVIEDLKKELENSPRTQEVMTYFTYMTTKDIAFIEIFNKAFDSRELYKSDLEKEMVITIPQGVHYGFYDSVQGACSIMEQITQQEIKVPFKNMSVNSGTGKEWGYGYSIEDISGVDPTFFHTYDKTDSRHLNQLVVKPVGIDWSSTKIDYTLGASEIEGLSADLEQSLEDKAEKTVKLSI